MRKEIMTLAALALSGAGCEKQQETPVAVAQVAQPTRVSSEPQREAEPLSPVATKKLFLDVHDLGAGHVTAQAVAGAHQRDLATEGKYGVDFKAYWVDEKAGKIYCLAEAPSAQATTDVHREAHGLLASKIMEVTADNASWAPTPGKKLYLDVHHFGPGKVSAKDVAAAHQKDLAEQSKHDTKYLNYWFDADTGTVMCLSEAASPEATLAVHREAHGLIPDSIEEVLEGR